MSQITRARTRHARAARAAAILEAAAELEQDTPFTRLAVADIARRAGLAKGTIFLYFPTKEALGLALLEGRLDNWFDALDAALGGSAPPRDPRAVARFMAASLRARPSLLRLLSLMGAVLEPNVEEERIGAFRERLLARMRVSGMRLEAVLPFLARGDGLRVLLFVQTLVIGLHPMADPAPAVKAVLERPDLAPLRVDFAGGLESAVRVHLEGLRALRSGGQPG